MRDARPRSRSSARRPLGSFASLLLAGLLLTNGCVYRSLTIKSDPAGAKVYINDDLKGETPLTYDFMWYGVHRVILRKEGYQRLDDQRLLRCPFYLWIPFDVALELIPLRIRDRREWTYTLTPAAELPSPKPPELVPAAGEAPASAAPASPAPEAPPATVTPVVGMPETPAAGPPPSSPATPSPETAAPDAGTPAAPATPEPTDAAR